jgi:hypothetical protein
MDAIFVLVKLLNTIPAIERSENMVFLAKIGFQTGDSDLAVIDY